MYPGYQEKVTLFIWYIAYARPMAPSVSHGASRRQGQDTSFQAVDIVPQASAWVLLLVLRNTGPPVSPPPMILAPSVE